MPADNFTTMTHIGRVGKVLELPMFDTRSVFVMLQSLPVYAAPMGSFEKIDPNVRYSLTRLQRCKFFMIRLIKFKTN